MTDVHGIDLNKKRQTPKLIYLGSEPRPYGINEQDTWGMNHYVAAVLANGLRMLVAYGNAVRDDDTYELMAAKLEFYATDAGGIIGQHIDWSQDPQFDDVGEGIEAYLRGNKEDWPAQTEYNEKVLLAEEVQRQYAREAMEWVTENFGELWD